MHEGFDWLSFLIGLPLAIVIISIVAIINHRIGKKKRWFDERYQEIQGKARSFSWLVTTVAMLLVWLVIIFMEGPGLAFFLMTGLWVIHMVSYLIGSILAQREEIVVSNNNKIGLIVSLIVLIGTPLFFIGVSYVTGNWKFLIFSLPPTMTAGTFGLLVSLKQIKKEQGHA